MKVSLGIQYHGAHFRGWQRQTNVVSVQQILEEALSKVANHAVETVCAGRTDAGVHALGQVVHFTTTSERPLKAWVQGTNRFMPPWVRVYWARVVDEEFSARFSAKSRTYKYVINQSSTKSPWLYKQVTWHPYSLDVAAMDEAAKLWLGENDFTSFRAQGCQSNSPFRNVISANVKQSGQWVVFEVTANAFLYHMVRNMAGTLLTIGQGRQQPIYAKELLEAKNRSLAPATAPADGLYLASVEYQDVSGLTDLPEAQCGWLPIS